ncbi:MAG: ABC transporter ATP-binding protein, partial [Candidatus Competibacteraceae bacterium]|nr:ABC transporter ATP-binding protein [Candidatus Competibacteraceae bacterium]
SPGRVSNGRVLFQGTDLLTASLPELRRIRGADISMIFQEPMSSLNPVFSIGDQIMETLRYHQKLSRRQARLRAIELLQRVELPGAAQRIDEYPHQLSGGMRQRVMIAMALACNPKILIADEPTTALDVTIQAQILDLLRQLQRELEMAVIMITHDLGIIAQFADRVAV